ncbi:MAG: type IV fimbrial biogenesis protein FimT [Lysobacterales bacterium]|jgi:type IV fimbrial biogenesis protein FimT
MKTSHSGFTAMELLITLALVSILTVAGIPGMRDHILNQQIKSATALLLSDLKLARNEAISMHTWTIACPGDNITGCSSQSQWSVGWLVFADLNGDRAWQADEPLLRNTNPLDDMSALSAESRKQIRFFSGGSAPGSNTSIVFCDGRGWTKGQKIVVSNSGRMRMAALSSSDETRCPPS